MAFLFQCSCSVRGSVGAFLLILVAFVSSGHAQSKPIATLVIRYNTICEAEVSISP